MFNLRSKFKTLQFFFKPRKIIAQYKLFFEDEWLEASVDSIAPFVHKILFVVSELAWGDNISDPKIKANNLEPLLLKIQQKYPEKVIIIKGKWSKQIEHVQAGLDYIKTNCPEATHCLYADSDEIFKKEVVLELIRLCKTWKLFQSGIRINYNMYFKTIYNKIDPIKYPPALVLFPLTSWVNYIDARNVNANTINILNLFYEHPAYVRMDDEKMRLKIEAHRETEPIIGDWYQDVWLNWTAETKNFHPTHPYQWEGTIKTDISELPPSMIEVQEKMLNQQNKA